MTLKSPAGRLLGLVLTGAAAAAVYFAFIDEMLDSSSNPAKARDKSLYKTANFTRALGAVRAREGGGAPMLEVQVLPGQARFRVAVGERARGYRYDAKTSDMEQVPVQIVGPGSSEGERFSLRRVPVDVTERLARAVRRHGGLRATTMTLERRPVLQWTVTAEGAGRTGVLFRARADGTALRPA